MRENPFDKRNPFIVRTRFFSTTKSIPRSPSTHSTNDSAKSTIHEDSKCNIQSQHTKFQKVIKPSDKLKKKTILNPFLNRKKLLPSDQKEVESYLQKSLKKLDYDLCEEFVEIPSFVDQAKPKKQKENMNLAFSLIGGGLQLGKRNSLRQSGVHERRRESFREEMKSSQSIERSPRFYFSKKMIEEDKEESLAELRDEVVKGKATLKLQNDGLPLKITVKNKEFHRAFVVRHR